MKNLTEYKDQSYNLQKMYEEFGNSLLDDVLINEGLSEKFDKVKEIAKRLKHKISDNISSAAENAIKHIKQKAGEKWNSIKDIYTSIISFVDQSLNKFKPILKNIGSLAHQSEDELEFHLANGYLKIFSSGNKCIDKIYDWMINFPETVKQTLAISILILCSDFLLGNEIDISFVGDLFDALKTSRSEV